MQGTPFPDGRVAHYRTTVALILIVEDNDSMRVGLQELLARAGYGVIATASVREAIEAIKHEAPDLLILDVRLGEFNGLQVLATANRPIPAIVTTGYADPVLESDARRFGAEYLLKPFATTDLMRLVRRKLGEQSASDGRGVRQSPRKRVADTIEVRAHQWPARIVDVSYGGMRIELAQPQEPELPGRFTVRVPSSDLELEVDLVWKQSQSEELWVLGAAVSAADQAAANAWRGLVDAVA